ncbi:hypothetical protein OROGR_008527 [Orobanche gracilis]
MNIPLNANTNFTPGRFEAKITDDSGTITASLFGKIAEAILGLTPMRAMEGVSQEYIQQRDNELSKQKYIVQIKMAKLKHREVTPKYTVATCVEDDNPQLLNKMTSDSRSIGSSSVTLSDEPFDASTCMISDISIPKETHLVAGASANDNDMLKNVAPETPLQVLSSRGKAKASLIGRFEEALDAPKSEAKKRRQ